MSPKVGGQKPPLDHDSRLDLAIEKCSGAVLREGVRVEAIVKSTERTLIGGRMKVNEKPL